MAKKIQIDLQTKTTKANKDIKKFAKNTEKGFSNINKSAKNMNKNLSTSIKHMAALVGSTMLLKKLATSFIDTAKETENFKVRLKVLLGSVEEGNRLFKLMAVYAGNVPFEFQEIMNSATMLAGIMKGGVNQINRWMPLIGDLSAAVGLGIRETTEQVMRMLSAGAAAADRFRERGVLSMLGFTAGVAYSAEETSKKLMEAWTKAGSKFKGATELMRTTWTGLMSMISDKWTRIKQNIADAGIFDALKDSLEVILELMGDVETSSGKAGESFEKIGNTIRTVNDFIRENKKLLLDIVKILGVIATVWIGGKIFKGLGLLLVTVKGIWKAFSFVGKYIISLKREIGMVTRGAIKFKMVLKNWGVLFVHAFKYIKLIRFTIIGLVGWIGIDLVGAMWESYKMTGKWFKLWDIGIRKIKNLWEELRHVITVGIVYLLKGVSKTLDLLLYRPLEVFINSFIDGINKIISGLNKIPKVNIPLLSEYKQTTLKDVINTNKLLEKESERHKKALVTIEEKFKSSETYKTYQVRKAMKLPAYEPETPVLKEPKSKMPLLDPKVLEEIKKESKEINLIYDEQIRKANQLGESYINTFQMWGSTWGDQKTYDIMKNGWSETLAAEQKLMDEINKLNEVSTIDTTAQASALRDMYSDMLGYGQEYNNQIAILIDEQAKLYENLGIKEDTIDKWVKAAKKRRLEEQSQLTRDSLASTAGNWASFFEYLGKENKKAFKAYKLMAITEALINTYSSAVAAYKSAATIPVVGWLAAPIAAAAAIAAGLVNVAAIRAQTFHEGGIVDSTNGLNYDEVPIIAKKGEGVFTQEQMAALGGSRGSVVNVIMKNPVFQDQNTQRRVFANIATQIVNEVAPRAVVRSYDNDGPIRSRVRSRS